MSLPEIHPWSIKYLSPVTDYSESIFAVGNGYLGIRGFSLQTPKQMAHEHSLFRAGFYEPVKPGITDLVQLPDTLGLVIKDAETESVHQELDLRNGVMKQEWRSVGLTVSTERIVSMADRQLICIRMKIQSDTDCSLIIDASMNDNVANLPVHDDQMTEESDTIRLLQTISKSFDSLEMKAVHSGRIIRFLQSLFVDGQRCSAEQFKVTCLAKKTYIVEKHVRVLFDGENANKDCVDPWAENEKVWSSLWNDCDIQMDTTEEIQGALRWNIFQMLCNNAPDSSAFSIGARGLTHGRYKGNCFWDTDIFLLPFFCWQRPEAAKNLVRYRVSHLPEAQALAKKQNVAGARFPWMCAVDGTEQCESWDIGLCEIHITADIAYAVVQACQILGDQLTPEMQKLLLETARYWKSRFTWEENRQQYSCFFVKGPDEYCGAAINNTYTNYMARNNVELALQFSEHLMSDQEKSEFRFFADHITILYDADKSLYKQDELFDRMEPLPTKRENAEPLYRTVCFDRMQRYKALKQADLVQLMVLFPDKFSEQEKLAVWNTYEPLTVHDSSLSFGVHAHLSSQLGLHDQAWKYFTRSLMLDLRDILHNTGREGVHMASLGATWQALVYGMIGLWTDHNGITSNVQLPEEVKSVSFSVWYHGTRYRISADHQSVAIVKEE